MPKKFTAYQFICLSYIGIILYLLYIRLRLITSYSLDLDGAEFCCINFIQMLAQGKPLYRNPLEFPFMAVQHAPLYPYLLYYCFRLMHFDLINDIHKMMEVARFISWLSMFINLYFINKIFKKLGLSFFYFLTAVTFYVLLITGHFYATRQDSIKTTLFTIFFYNILQFVFYNEGKKVMVFAILSGVVMVLFKQDSIIYLYLVLISLCTYMQNKKVFRLSLWFTGCLLVSIITCYLIFGKYLFINTVIFNIQVLTDTIHSFNILVVFFSVVRNFPLFVLAVAGSFYAIRNFKNKEVKYFLPLITVICFFVAHISMFRAGSYLNYTYELILLLIVNAALLIREHENYFRKHLKLFSAFMVFYIVSIGLTNRIIHSYTYDKDLEAAKKNDYYTELNERDQIISLTNHQLVFLPNFKYVVFFASTPFIWGYEMHFDRMLEVFLKYKTTSKLLFVSTAKYDSYFTDGRVKYIITENNNINDIHVSKYYPHYLLYKTYTKFRVYKYSS